MKFIRGTSIVAIIAESSYLLTSIQCLDIVKENPMMAAADCQTANGRRNCKFSNSNRLKLDIDDTIELTVDDTNGRTITCTKKINELSTNWYGSCDGDADDLNIVARFNEVDGTNRIFGSIHVGHDICRIYPNINTDGINIECMHQSSFKPEDEPIKSAGMKMLQPPERRRRLSDSFGFVPIEDVQDNRNGTSLQGHNKQTKSRRRLFDDSGGNIDILVVWTRSAECATSNLSATCTVTAATEENMRGLVDLAVYETNVAFNQSGILTSLRLVHAYRDPNYVENGQGNFTSYLFDVTLDGDGDLDSVHDNRALYGADIVHMIVGDDTGPCGIGWTGNPIVDEMFGVSNYRCAIGFYTFGHEIGHNFNLFHDRASEDACDEVDTFNYGYINPNAEFRTILSYDCEVGNVCKNLPKDGCDRVQHFSNANPKYKYNGMITGNAQNDNARQFNNGLASAASFFPAMDCQSDMECNDQNSATVDTCNQENRVCIFSPSSAPISTPVRPPPPVPVTVPVSEPVSVPVSVPVSAPVIVPVSLPAPSPVSTPVRSPVVLSPVRRPVLVLTRPPVPVSTPVRSPVLLSPVRRPVVVLTRPPVPTPVRPPVPAPIRRPISAPARPIAPTPILPPVSEPVRPPVTAPGRLPSTATPVRPPTRIPTQVLVPISVRPPGLAPVVRPPVPTTLVRPTIPVAPTPRLPIFGGPPVTAVVPGPGPGLGPVTVPTTPRPQPVVVPIIQRPTVVPRPTPVIPSTPSAPTVTVRLSDILAIRGIMDKIFLLFGNQN